MQNKNKQKLKGFVNLASFGGVKKIACASKGKTIFKKKNNQQQQKCTQDRNGTNAPVRKPTTKQFVALWSAGQEDPQGTVLLSEILVSRFD